MENHRNKHFENTLTMALEVNRNYSIDLVKSVAIFSVIAWHFFDIHTPFLYSNYNGLSMFLQGFFMKVFQICVPLFCLCIGYLNYNKTKYDKKYIKGILKVLSSYIFFCIIFFLFRTLIMNEDISLRHAIGMTLRFNMIRYGWYIEMWIGLYLLTPLINKALNLCSKKETLIICFILYFLTSLPNTFNRFGFYLFPSFWTQIWPLTYYVVGRYIKENESVKNTKNLLLVTIFFLGSLLEPILNLFYTDSSEYLCLLGSQNENIIIVPVSIAVFVLLLKVQFHKNTSKYIVKKISQYSLDMYLCCWMFDVLLYPFFLSHYYESQSTFWPYFFIIVPLCFMFSFITAGIKVFIFKLLKIEKIWK